MKNYLNNIQTEKSSLNHLNGDITHYVPCDCSKTHRKFLMPKIQSQHIFIGISIVIIICLMVLVSLIPLIVVNLLKFLPLFSAVIGAYTGSCNDDSTKQDRWMYGCFGAFFGLVFGVLSYGMINCTVLHPELLHTIAQ